MKMNLRILLILSLLPSVTFSQKSVGDTLKVNPNSIIFYSITQAESDSINFEGKAEVLDDFYYHSGNIISNYKNDDSYLVVMLTAHRHYLLFTNNEQIYIDRSALDHFVGMILVREDAYEIFTGVDTDVGLDLTIKEFFRF